jgi:hypothetical protein
MDFLTEAERYASIGFKVFPQKPGSKEPATAHGVHDATDDADVLAEWARKYPYANIAAACGPASGITVVDIDKHHGGIEIFKALLAKYKDRPTCPIARSPQGGYHLYFKHDLRIGTSQNRLGQGIDIRSNGGAITLPPSHWNGFKRGVKVAEPGDYRWVRAPVGSNMPPMPRWMLKLLLPKPIPKFAPRKWDKSNASLAQVARALKHVPNYVYGTWTRVGMGLKASFGDEALPIWTNWSCAGYSDFDERACQRKWNSFKRSEGITVGTVFHEARLAGADLEEIFRST